MHTLTSHPPYGVLSAIAAFTLLAAASATPTSVWSVPAGGPGPDNTVYVMQVASPPGGGGTTRLYLGGLFSSVGGQSTPNLASWDGAAWHPGPGVPAPVRSLTVHPYNGTPTLFAGGSSFIAGGSSFSTGGAPVARLMPGGTDGQWVAVPVGTQSWVSGVYSYDLGAGAGPAIAVSSTFFTPSEYIASWSAGALSAIGTGLITVTNAFAVFDDGQGPRLWAGAGADNFVSLSFVSRFDGPDWIHPAGGLNNVVNAMQVFDDGAGLGPCLFIGGDFRFAGISTPSPLQCNRIVRFRNGGWSTLGTGMNAVVRALAVFDDGTGDGPLLYAAGDFATAGDQPASRIAKWKNGQWSAVGAGITGGPVHALAVFDDDGQGPIRPALYAAGAFTSAGGLPAQRFARWGVVRCGADYNASGQTTVQDIYDFLTDWNQSAAAADFNGQNGITVQDIYDFLGAWNAGCP